MKRTPLLRRSLLSRKGRLRARRQKMTANPARDAWKQPGYGLCLVCGQPGWLSRHHVTYEQHVRREGGDLWDLANAMDVGRDCPCHEQHHNSSRRIKLERVPEAAIAFAVDLLGEDRAVAYFERYYDCGRAAA